jgi:hypothetical protein
MAFREHRQRGPRPTSSETRSAGRRCSSASATPPTPTPLPSTVDARVDHRTERRGLCPPELRDGRRREPGDDGAQVTFSFTGTPDRRHRDLLVPCTTVSGTAGKIIGWVSLGSARTFVNLDTDKVTPTVAD